MPTLANTQTYGNRLPAFDHQQFGVALVISLLVGAIIRLLYVFSFFGRPDPVIGGDGISYHLEALRLANGLGYTSAMWDVGAQTAHHPPAWVTVLAGFSALGIDTIHGHQLLGVFIGLLVIGVVAVIGRIIFGYLSGALAGAIAAIYPGFWVLDAQILAEPFALVMLGMTIIAFYRFSRETNIRHALEVGFFLGLTVLARSEQLALLIMLAPIFLFNATHLSLARRVMLSLIVIGCVALLLGPWVIHNANRFDEPVLISTNMGAGLLTGNCATTFEGKNKGFYDTYCFSYSEKPGQDADRSTKDRLHREAAIEQIQENLDKLPLTIVARYGRAFGLYKPAHTVTEVANWHGTDTWPVWLWVISFWVVGLLALVGIVTAIRARIDILPLAIPIFVMLGVVGVFFGEPRYHTMADLSFVVLSGYGLLAIVNQWSVRRARRR